MVRGITVKEMSPSCNEFEVGSVYRKKDSKTIFIACDFRKIFTVNNRKLEIYEDIPGRIYLIDRELTVADLIITWEITLEELDAITTVLFYQNRLPEVSDTRFSCHYQRTTPREYKSQDDVRADYEDFRTHRLGRDG